MSIPETTVETVLTIGVGGLTTAVVTLFALFNTGYKRVCTKLDECERDRRELWEAIGKKANK